MRIALYQPDIAGNVGVDLIEPMGFAFGDRAMARAGMDYAAQADVARHVDWDAFEAQRSGRLVLLTTKSAGSLYGAQFATDDVLLFGSEGAGVPDTVHDHADLRVTIPMRPGFRSLNVAVAAAMTLGEALRQTRLV